MIAICLFHLENLNFIPKILRQANIADVCCGGKERCYLFGTESRYTATDARHEEVLSRMCLGIINKLVHIRTNGVYTALHGWYAITLPL